MQHPLQSTSLYLALERVFPARHVTRTGVRIGSVQPQTYRTNRCSPQRSHLLPGARSVRCASPARSSYSRTTIPSTGRSTGTSHLVRFIRIGRRYGEGTFAGGRANRLRRPGSASPPLLRAPQPRAADRTRPLTHRVGPQPPSTSNDDTGAVASQWPLN